MPRLACVGAPETGRGPASPLAKVLAVLGLSAVAALGATAGCAQVIDADFGEKSLETCYTGPRGTEGQGLCAAGRREREACVGEILPVIEDCTTPDLDESCDGEAACTGAIQRSWSFGSGADQDYSLVEVDGASNILLGVAAFGSVDYGGGAIPDPAPADGDRNVHLVKLSPTGEHLWSKSFGDSTFQDIGGIGVDAGGEIVVAGYSEGNIQFEGCPPLQGSSVAVFLAKLTADGACVWSRRFGGELQKVTVDMTLAADRSILLAGEYEGAIDFGDGRLESAGSTDVFVARFSADGSLLWSKRFGDAAEQQLYSATTDPSGDIAMTGFFYGQLDFGRSPHEAGILQKEAFVAKLDAEGDEIWSQTLKGDVDLWTVAMNDGGDVFAVGHFRGSLDLSDDELKAVDESDVLVAHYTAQGQLAWRQSFGDQSNQSGDAIAVDAAGNLLIGGHTRGGITFGQAVRQASQNDDLNAFIAKLSPDGNILWGRLFDGPGEQKTWWLTSDALGNLVATGRFEASIALQDESPTSRGMRDIWVATLRP